MAVRLSICIATYNRARFLAQSLHSILGQDGADEVEVVILDGASPDDTAAVVEPFVGAHPGRVHYHREAEKGGVDRDYAKAVARAQGDYCWLLSDDDPLKPGALRAVLTAIAGGCSLVVVNAEVRTADLGRQLEERRLAVTADRELTGLEELFTLTVDYLTFIGAVVIRRELWLARPHEAYIGSEFIHLGVIFQAPLPAPARVIAEPLISLRYGNAQWSGRSFEIWMFKYPRLIWSLAALSEAARARAVAREPWRRLGRAFSFRAKGSYDLAVYRRLIVPACPAGPRRWALFLIACFPGPLANLLAHVAFACKPRCSPLNWVDLRNSRHYFMKGLGLARRAST